MDRPKDNNESGKAKIFRVVISAFCTVFFCRRYFSEGVSDSIDSGWIWALNRAIHDGRTFGTEFAFTYGPLGFLSTRYTGYIGAWPLLVGDCILAAGFFYFVLRKVTFSIPGVIVMLGSVLLLRNAFFAQALFSLFFIYMSLVYTEQRQSRVILFFAALYSVMLFFMKVNYGVIVPVFLLGGIALLVARRDWQALTWLMGLVVTFSVCILLLFNVNIPGYIRNGISLISGYEEAMFLPVDFHSVEYNLITMCLVAAFLLVIIYVIMLLRRKAMNAGQAMFVCLFSVSVFLAYKNGITRFDVQHTRQFLALFPFLILAAATITGEASRGLLLVLMGGVVATSFEGTTGKANNAATIAEEVWSLVSVHGYYSTLGNLSTHHYNAGAAVSSDASKRIGESSVDIIPHELYVAPANDLNYCGRPVCQSYSVYKPELDRLNARFFASTRAPYMVMVSGKVIDQGCYRGFYEPMTHAAIRLNYDYKMTTLPADSLPANNNEYFVVFEKSPDGNEQPIFCPTSTGVYRLSDTISVPDSEKPVYMRARIKYTTLGKLNKLLLQPMPVTITFYMDDGQYYDYRLQLPMLESPVPVGRLLSSTREMWYFLSGRWRHARKIKAFKISTHNPEIDRQVEITFYTFDNYRRMIDMFSTRSAAPGPHAALRG